MRWRSGRLNRLPAALIMGSRQDGTIHSREYGLLERIVVSAGCLRPWNDSNTAALGEPKSSSYV